MAVYTKIETTTATIANGATTSGVVELGASAVLGIEMPAAFTGTALAIHGASASGGTYAPLRDSGGTALSITTAAGYRHYIDPLITAGWAYIKVVSGSTEGGSRVITLTVRPV